MDALLTGIVQSGKNYFYVDLILRDVSGKARIHCVYDEPFRPDTLAYFPASTSSSGWPFHFPMLDGVTLLPLKTAAFPYPASYKPVILSGNVVISMVVATDGNVEQARIVQRWTRTSIPTPSRSSGRGTLNPPKARTALLCPFALAIQLRFRAKGMPSSRNIRRSVVSLRPVGTGRHCSNFCKSFNLVAPCSQY